MECLAHVYVCDSQSRRGGGRRRPYKITCHPHDRLPPTPVFHSPIKRATCDTAKTLATGHVLSSVPCVRLSTYNWVTMKEHQPETTANAPAKGAWLQTHENPSHALAQKLASSSYPPARSSHPSHTHSANSDSTAALLNVFAQHLGSPPTPPTCPFLKLASPTLHPPPFPLPIPCPSPSLAPSPHLAPSRRTRLLPNTETKSSSAMASQW